MSTTVTRKQYNASGTETVLGLPAESKSEQFDGSIDYTGIQIDDAFNVGEVSLPATTSPNALSLAADIASVRLQPRLITSAFTTPKVNGLEMQVKTGEGVPDGYKVFALPKDGEVVTYTSKAASLGAVDDTFSWTDADGGHSFTRSELMVAVAECLGAADVTGCVALGKMTEVVSILGEGMTDTEAMMDGRTSMAGYPVEGATDVVWATVPYAQLMSMAQEPFKGTKVLTALLVALGMPSGMARSECQLLSGGSLKEMTLNDGELSSDTALQYGTDSLLACKAGTTQRPWIYCGIDGGSALVWVGNQCVFSLLAAMAKKTMDSLCGLALVGVGENGGVMGWMVSILNEYPMLKSQSISYAYLTELYNSYPCIANYGKDYIKTDGSAYIVYDRSHITNGIIIETVFNYLNGSVWQFGAVNTSGNSDDIGFAANAARYGTRYSGSNSTIQASTQTNDFHKYTLSGTQFGIDGTMYNHTSGSGQSMAISKDFYIFKANGSSLTPRGCSRRFIVYNSDGSIKSFLVPFTKDGNVGLLDIISKKEYKATGGSLTYHSS